MTLRAAYALVAQCAAGLRTLVLQPASGPGLQALAQVRVGGLVAWSASEIHFDALRHLGSTIPFGLPDRSMDAIAWLEGPRADMVAAREILRECERVLAREGWLVVRVPSHVTNCDEPFWQWHDALAERFPAVMAVAEFAWSGASFALCADQRPMVVEAPKVQLVENLIGPDPPAGHHLLFAAVAPEHLPVLCGATFVPERVGPAAVVVEDPAELEGDELPSSRTDDALANLATQLAANTAQLAQVQVELASRDDPPIHVSWEREAQDRVVTLQCELAGLRSELAAARAAAHQADLQLATLANRLRRQEERAYHRTVAQGDLGRVRATLHLLLRQPTDPQHATCKAQTAALLQALLHREEALTRAQQELLAWRSRSKRERRHSTATLSNASLFSEEHAMASDPTDVGSARALAPIPGSTASATTIPEIDEREESLRELVAYLGLQIPRAANQPPATVSDEDMPQAQVDDGPLVRPLAELAPRAARTSHTPSLARAKRRG